MSTFISHNLKLDVCRYRETPLLHMVRPLDQYNIALPYMVPQTHFHEVGIFWKPIQIDVVRRRQGWVMVNIDKCGASDDLSFSPRHRFDKTFCECSFSCAQVTIEQNDLAGSRYFRQASTQFGCLLCRISAYLKGEFKQFQNLLLP